MKITKPLSGGGYVEITTAGDSRYKKVEIMKSSLYLNPYWVEEDLIVLRDVLNEALGKKKLIVFQDRFV